MTHSHSQSF